jgi:hypothetical protein
VLVDPIPAGIAEVFPREQRLSKPVSGLLHEQLGSAIDSFRRAGASALSAIPDGGVEPPALTLNVDPVRGELRAEVAIAFAAH